MTYDFKITSNERQYLRELAKKQAEYAGLPVMDERRKLWYSHNALKANRPVVVMEMKTFENDMLPQCRCESAVAIEIEKEINRYLINHEMIDDDKVIPSYYPVNMKINIKWFSEDILTRHVPDSKGRTIGYAWEHRIKDLKNDIAGLKPSTYSFDREYTYAWKEFVQEVLGDILPVKIKNRSLDWSITPSARVVFLMGLENMMFSMMDYPRQMHMLYSFITEDLLRYVKWQEKENLLVTNNENDYAGAGSYGFTDELNVKDRSVTTDDLWVNMNSQETVGISSLMYEEFVFPSYEKLAGIFGLVYYGCCEPVDSIWDNCISRIPNLRKVSVSPWCNEEFMGEALKGKKVIYSRKPSPNYLGVEKNFDEDAFRSHIRKTLEAARDVKLEFVFRDIYTLAGDNTKAARAVDIVRQMCR